MSSLESLLNGGYVKTNCPNPEHEDSDPSYVIYPTQGYCFGCGFKETPEQIMERTGGKFDTVVSRKSRTSSDPIRNVEGHVRFWHNTLCVGPRQSRISWFEQRGISRRSIDLFRLGHSGDHFTIPIWTDGRICGFKKRADPKFVDPDAPKYLNQRGSGSIFTTFTWSGNLRPENVVVTEGELDAIAISQYGYSAITSTVGSSGLSESVARSIQHIPTVYAATDMDDAGDKAYEELKGIRPDIRRLIFTEGNDISEFLVGVDSGSRGEALRTLIREADNRERNTATSR